MNFHNIEYFIAITEEKSISRSAEKMHISQQALSEQLKKLEDEVGTPLIKRSHPIALTPAGEVLLARGRKLLKEYNVMMAEIETIAQRDRSRLTIGIPSTGMPPFLPRLLKQFSEKYPEIQVKTIEIKSRDASRLSDAFDLFFSTLPLGNELENIIIAQDEYVAAIPNELGENVYGDRWASVRQQLEESRKLQTVSRLPFISTHNNADEPMLDQKLIVNEAGFKPDVVFQSQNYELNFNVCISGKGAFITTRLYCAESLKNKSLENDIRFYTLKTPIDPVCVALSYRKGRKLRKAAEKFISLTKEYFAE